MYEISDQNLSFSRLPEKKKYNLKNKYWTANLHKLRDTLKNPFGISYL